ncbi:MAG: DNA cytosine methyltransferase [Armatimonadota bacterium]
MPVRVFDFFSGCGGTSAGLQAAGCEIILGLDNDRDSAATFRHNFPNASFIERDIREVEVEDLAPFVDAHADVHKLFCGCAPCQPFSSQNKQRGILDQRSDLLTRFGYFVEHFTPEFVLVENVPGIQRIENEGPLTEFVAMLERLGYEATVQIVDFKDYGVPQRRRRLVLLASLVGVVPFPIQSHGPGRRNPRFSTVADWIADLPPVAAGETHPEIPNHQAASLTAINLQRLLATPEGGDRRNWPADLILPCHSNAYNGHTDVYGRMRWQEPAGSLTTRCHSISNGRFGHPEQNRAITVREAACLQTFPRTFIFCGGIQSTARQVGNAVPVLMARHFGEALVTHIELQVQTQAGNGDI